MALILKAPDFLDMTNQALNFGGKQASWQSLYAQNPPSAAKPYGRAWQPLFR